MTSALLAPPAFSRRHRVHRIAPSLRASLAVDEQEWSVRPSQTVVAAGKVTLHAYDRGQDPHNMTIVGPHGQIAEIAMQPGGSGSVAVTLAPGTYRLVCTLFAGTPQSHEALGMHALLTVR
ncbi:MAG: cupredoxin domain-containing protein [Solirubrobacteraceae bacterium]